MSEGTSRPAGEDEYYDGKRLYQEGRLLQAEQVLRQGIERHQTCNRRSRRRCFKQTQSAWDFTPNPSHLRRRHPSVGPLLGPAWQGDRCLVV